MKSGSGILLAALILSSTVWAQADSAHREFEVASIKRNLSGDPWFWGPHRGGRWTATNASLKRLVSLAWRTPLFAISGGPSWIGSDKFDIRAKEPDANTTDDEFLLMLQNLLTARFALKVHTEMRTQPVYFLLPAKGGLKLPEATPEPCAGFALKPNLQKLHANSQPACEGMNVTPGLISDGKVSMVWFTAVLEGFLGRPLVNKTGFSGSFKLHLQFDPVNVADSDGTRPSIFSALQDQLGLRLETGKDAAEILVIDDAKRPSEN